MGPFTEKKTLNPIDERLASIEAEKGEVAVTDLMDDGIPESYVINGKSHANGGSPLDIPDYSFIFSKFKDMKITDPVILADFDMPENKKGYTPAEIAKKYNLNKYKKILLDPDSTEQERNTAQLMIKNFMLKFGELALVQESMKGFDNRIPMISLPYMNENGIEPEMLLAGNDQQEVVSPTACYGGQFEKGGQTLTKYQTKGEVKGYKKEDIPKNSLYYDNRDLALEDITRRKGNVENKPLFVLGDDGLYHPISFNKLQGPIYEVPEEYDIKEQTQPFEYFYQHFLNNEDDLKALYEDWKNGKYKTKVYKSGKYEESDIKADVDSIKELAKENNVSEEKAWLGWFASQYAEYNQYRLNHINDWEKWHKPSDKSGSLAKKNYLNTYDHAEKFKEETGWNDADIELLQTMQIAINNFARTDRGKKIGLYTDSTDKEDPNSQAGFSTTTRGGKEDTTYADSMPGSRTLDWTVGLHIPEYEIVDSQYTPEEKAKARDVKYEPLETHPERPLLPHIPSMMRAGNAFWDLATLRGYYPSRQNIENIEAIPEFLDNTAEVANLNSLGATMASNLGFDADPNMNRLNAGAVAPAIAENIIKSDANTYNKNIDIANNFEQYNTNLAQEVELKRAEADKKYVDELNATNNRFDSSKRALKQRYMDEAYNFINRSVDFYNRGTNDYYFDPFGAIRYEPHYWERIKAEAQNDNHETIKGIAEEHIKNGMDREKAYNTAINEWKALKGIQDNPYESILRQNGIVI